MQRQREVFHFLMHFPNAINSWSSTRPKQGFRNLLKHPSRVAGKLEKSADASLSVHFEDIGINHGAETQSDPPVQAAGIPSDICYTIFKSLYPHKGCLTRYLRQKPRQQISHAQLCSLFLFRLLNKMLLYKNQYFNNSFLIMMIWLFNYFACCNKDLSRIQPSIYYQTTSQHTMVI